jgi:hypothetical protein
MTRSEFQLLTQQMQQADKEWSMLMDRFVTLTTAGKTDQEGKVSLTADDQRRAFELFQRKKELARRWLAFMRSDSTRDSRSGRRRR